MNHKKHNIRQLWFEFGRGATRPPHPPASRIQGSGAKRPPLGENQRKNLKIIQEKKYKIFNVGSNIDVLTSGSDLAEFKIENWPRGWPQKWKMIFLKPILTSFHVFCHMAMPYGKAIWQSHMAMPYGKAIWQCHMAKPYGEAIWQGHMAKPSGRAICQPRPRLPPRLRPCDAIETGNFFQELYPGKSDLENWKNAKKNRLQILYRMPYLKKRDLFSRTNFDYLIFSSNYR